MRKSLDYPNLKIDMEYQVMKKILLILIFTISGCAKYTPPEHGPIASLKVESLSHYNDVKVELCKNEKCDSPFLIGLLAGKGYLYSFKKSPSVMKEYENRLSHNIKIQANKISYIKLSTEKTVIKIGDKAKRRSEFQEVFGRTKITRWLDYTESKNELACIVVIEIRPLENSQIDIIHDHDEKTEECSASINLK